MFISCHVECHHDSEKYICLDLKCNKPPICCFECFQLQHFEHGKNVLSFSTISETFHSYQSIILKIVNNLEKCLRELDSLFFQFNKNESLRRDLNIDDLYNDQKKLNLVYDQLKDYLKFLQQNFPCPDSRYLNFQELRYNLKKMKQIYNMMSNEAKIEVFLLGPILLQETFQQLQTHIYYQTQNSEQLEFAQIFLQINSQVQELQNVLEKITQPIANDTEIVSQEMKSSSIKNYHAILNSNFIKSNNLNIRIWKQQEMQISIQVESKEKKKIIEQQELTEEANKHQELKQSLCNQNNKKIHQGNFMLFFTPLIMILYHLQDFSKNKAINGFLNFIKLNLQNIRKDQILQYKITYINSFQKRFMILIQFRTQPQQPQESSKKKKKKKKKEKIDQRNRLIYKKSEQYEFQLIDYFDQYVQNNQQEFDDEPKNDLTYNQKEKSILLHLLFTNCEQYNFYQYEQNYRQYENQDNYQLLHQINYVYFVEQEDYNALIYLFEQLWQNRVVQHRNISPFNRELIQRTERQNSESSFLEQPNKTDKIDKNKSHQQCKKFFECFANENHQNLYLKLKKMTKGQYRVSSIIKQLNETDEYQKNERNQKKKKKLLQFQFQKNENCNNFNSSNPGSSLNQCNKSSLCQELKTNDKKDNYNYNDQETQNQNWYNLYFEIIESSETEIIQQLNENHDNVIYENNESSKTQIIQEQNQKNQNNLNQENNQSSKTKIINQENENENCFNLINIENIELSDNESQLIQERYYDDEKRNNHKIFYKIQCLFDQQQNQNENQHNIYQEDNESSCNESQLLHELSLDYERDIHKKIFKNICHFDYQLNENENYHNINQENQDSSIFLYNESLICQELQKNDERDNHKQFYQNLCGYFDYQENENPYNLYEELDEFTYIEIILSSFLQELYENDNKDSNNQIQQKYLNRDSNENLLDLFDQDQIIKTEEENLNNFDYDDNY